MDSDSLASGKLTPPLSHSGRFSHPRIYQNFQACVVST